MQECIHQWTLTLLRLCRYSDVMGHTRRTVLTAPIPTVEQIAQRFGVSRRRVKRLERLIDSFIASDARRRRAARAKKKPTNALGR